MSIKKTHKRNGVNKDTVIYSASKALMVSAFCICILGVAIHPDDLKGHDINTDSFPECLFINP